MAHLSKDHKEEAGRRGGSSGTLKQRPQGRGREEGGEVVAYLSKDHKQRPGRGEGVVVTHKSKDHKERPVVGVGGRGGGGGHT